ncbi:hypothetical protein ABPG72_019788 [Tetrahymena utriculariae]
MLLRQTIIDRQPDNQDEIPDQNPQIQNLIQQQASQTQISPQLSQNLAEINQLIVNQINSRDQIDKQTVMNLLQNLLRTQGITQKEIQMLDDYLAEVNSIGKTRNKTQQKMEQNIEWKEIKGFSKYEISNTGLVRNKKTQRVLKPRENHAKTLQVCLTRDGEKKQINQTISKLVAFNFLENPNNSKLVKHKNNNIQDNSVQNLYFQ